MCSSPSNSYYSWQEYNAVKRNWRGTLTVDIWATLYSLETTSKPYFREQRTCIFLSFLVHPFCFVVRWTSEHNEPSASRCDHHASNRKRAKLDFISCSRWLYVHNVMLRPISDHCLFREASANQEALQGPVPPTHRLYCYFCHDDCFIYCWFIKLCLLFMWMPLLLWTPNLFCCVPDVKACKLHISMF